MNNDTELFELCKQVYDATGWKQSQNISQLYEYWDDYDELCVISIEDADDALVPAYASDYLLEKLPPALWVEVFGEGQQVALLALNMQGNGEAIAVYEIPYDKEFRGSYSSHADTPLKALLKLTLKLHEEE